MPNARRGIPEPTRERGIEWVIANKKVDWIAETIGHEDGLSLTTRQRQLILSGVLQAMSDFDKAGARPEEGAPSEDKLRPALYSVSVHSAHLPWASRELLEQLLTRCGEIARAALAGASRPEGAGQ